mgnify:CR=1 FL=1
MSRGPRETRLHLTRVARAAAAVQIHRRWRVRQQPSARRRGPRASALPRPRDRERPRSLPRHGTGTPRPPRARPAARPPHQAPASPPPPPTHPPYTPKSSSAVPCGRGSAARRPLRGLGAAPVGAPPPQHAPRRNVRPPRPPRPLLRPGMGSARRSSLHRGRVACSSRRAVRTAARQRADAAGGADRPTWTRTCGCCWEATTSASTRSSPGGSDSATCAPPAHISRSDFALFPFRGDWSLSGSWARGV